MKWTTTFRFFIGILLTQSYVSYSQPTDEIISIINSNISNGNIEQNLDVYKDLKSYNYFDSIDCRSRSKILHKIGVSLYLKDANLEAANFYKTQVLPSWELCNDKKASEYANSIYNTGVSLQFADKYQEARPYFHRSIELFESDSLYSKIKLSSKYAGMARFYKDAQSYIRAENYYEAAIQIISQIDQKSSRLGRYQQDLGVTLNEMGQYSKAIPYFKSAIDIFKNNHDQFRLAMTYHNIAISYLESDIIDSTNYSLDSAQYFVNKSLELHKDNDTFLSNDYEILGLIYKRRRNLAKSKSLLLSSLKLRKRGANNQRAVASSFENLSELSKEINPLEARILIDSAIFSLVIRPKKNRFGNPVIKDIITLNDVSVIRAMGIKAKLYEQNINDTADVNVVLDLYKKIDSLFTINIFNLRFEKSRLSYLQLLYDNYSDAIDFCVLLHRKNPNLGYDALAFSYATKTKAFVLINEIKENERYSKDVDPKLEQDKNDAQILIRNLFLKIVETVGDSSKIISDYLKAQRSLEYTLAKIDSAQGSKKSDKYSLISHLDVQKIQNSIEDDQLYIEYFLGKDNLYSFVITQDDFNLIHHPELIEIEKLSSKLNDLTIDRNSKMIDVNKIRNELSSFLLSDEHRLQSKDKFRWIIIPDGFLHHISFDLLNLNNDPSRYLMEDFVLSTAYSSGSLFQYDDTVLGDGYVGFGTSYTSQLNDRLNINIANDTLMFVQLEQAENEIVSCASKMNGQAYLGPNSSKSTFENEWPNGDIIHLSLHGYVDQNYYDKSFLLFDDREIDNILYLPELVPQEGKVQLVVLSSCHTASGQLFKGEGVQGLTKAFLKSGNTTVVASLWEASDLSASQIIPCFFDFLKKGNSVGVSLNKAKLLYLENAPPSQRHPYYWANFQIVGQSELSLKDSTYIWWIGLLLLIALSFGLIKRAIP